MCPITKSDRHDGPGLVDELVPGIAAVIEDVVVGAEDTPIDGCTLSDDDKAILAKLLRETIAREGLSRSERGTEEYVTMDRTTIDVRIQGPNALRTEYEGDDVRAKRSNDRGRRGSR